MAEHRGARSDESGSAERGTLEVRTRALQHIVERTVLGAEGAVTHRRALGKLRGGDSPQAAITMEGRHARVSVDVAAVWPCRVSDIAERVRETVMQEAPRLSGVDVRTVDVTVHVLRPGDVDEHQRRRAQ